MDRKYKELKKLLSPQTVVNFVLDQIPIYSIIHYGLVMLLCSDGKLEKFWPFYDGFLM